MKRHTSLTLCALILAPTILSAQPALPPLTPADISDDGSFSFVCTDVDHCHYLPPDTASSRLPAAVSNHVENPGFDNNATTGLLRAWTFFQEQPDPSNAVVWSSLDRASSPASGSARVTNSINVNVPLAWGNVGISQCMPYAPGPPATASSSGYVFLPTGQPLDDNGVTLKAYAMITQWHYTDLDCTIPNGGGGSGFVVWSTNLGAWLYKTIPAMGINANTRSYRRGLTIQRQVAPGVTLPPSIAYFDDLVVTTSAGDPWAPMKGDFDRDGETDLVLRNNTTGDNYVWFMKDEARDSGPTIISPSPLSSDWQIAAVDNFSAAGSSRDDLLMWNAATGQLEFWLMNGTSRVGPGVPGIGREPAWKPSAAADVNGDGVADVFWRNYSTQKLELWTNFSGSSIVVPQPDQAVAANWEIVGAPDLNGDGQTDLLWYNWSSGKIVYWTMKYSANATECAGVGLSAPCYYRLTGNFTYPANAGQNNWKVLATGDYGIGPASSSGTPIANTTDLIWRNATSGRMVLWFMDKAGNRTGGVFITPDPPAPATDWTIAGPR